jgi:hypothetical protein
MLLHRGDWFEVLYLATRRRVLSADIRATRTAVSRCNAFAIFDDDSCLL